MIKGVISVCVAELLLETPQPSKSCTSSWLPCARLIWRDWPMAVAVTSSGSGLEKSTMQGRGTKLWPSILLNHAPPVLLRLGVHILHGTVSDFLTLRLATHSISNCKLSRSSLAAFTSSGLYERGKRRTGTPNLPPRSSVPGCRSSSAVDPSPSFCQACYFPPSFPFPPELH